ncbi:DUF2982 domain-containing protein [Thalassotalea eurytherma]|nr:DUF2982 domain-containing protein [Thalassotalea eurytherma]
MTQSIKIHSNATRHSLFITVLGCVMLLICLLLSNYLWSEAKLVLIFLTLVSVVVLVTGITKHIEPKCSFEISPQAVVYQHRCGQWQLAWSDIRYIAPVTTSRGIEQQTLPYVGIRLEELDKFAEAITPRLANKLIHEQRPLLILAVQHGLLSVEQITLRFQPYKSAYGLIKGPIAEFLYQSANLQQAFGFHLMIPSTALDRSIEEFSVLLKQCKESAQGYVDEDA